MVETFRDLLAKAANEAPDKPWLRFGEQVYTFGVLQSLALRLATGLERLGVAKGDKVCLYLPNCPEFILAMFAVTELGAVYVPANSNYRSTELQYVVDHSDALVLICTAGNVGTVSEMRGECPRLRHIVVVGDGPAGTIALDDLLIAGDERHAPCELTGEDIAAILYTSGTTGRPKGVLLHHSAYVRTGYEWSAYYGWTAESNIICMLPLFHINAQAYSTMATLACQAGLIVLSQFSASRFWDDVRRFDVTAFVGMPTVTLMLWNQPPSPRERDHKVTRVVSIVPPAIWQQWEARFGCVMTGGFSMTECMMGLLGPLDPANRKIGAAGKPSPGLEARIVDEGGREVSRGTPGELVLRSWAMMKGYYKQPEITASTLRDGWLHTGDMLYQDEDGYFWFVDRLKDIVRRGGENISSAEVEAVIQAYPGVAEAAVVPVRDPVWEEEVKAYVILKEGFTQETVPPEKIVSWCEERLAKFKVPRYIEYRQDFPRTATFKAQKAELRKEKPDLRAGSWDRAEGRWLQQLTSTMEER